MFCDNRRPSSRSTGSPQDSEGTVPSPSTTSTPDSWIISDQEEGTTPASTPSYLAGSPVYPKASFHEGEASSIADSHVVYGAWSNFSSPEKAGNQRSCALIEFAEAVLSREGFLEMQSSGFEYPGQQAPIKAEAFYDPSSADGYGDPSNDAFFASGTGFHPLVGGTGVNSQSSLDPNQQFREADIGKSPFSSPHIDPISPDARHRRSSSFGSEAVSPPAFSLPNAGLDANLAQPLGQLGQITLDENARYPPVFDQEGLETSSVSSFYSQSNSPSLNPSQPQYAGQLTGSGAVGPSATYTPSHSSSPAPERSQPSAPQLSLGIPVVSVSDTTMDFQPNAHTETMPSIQVMAPSPSTPKAGGRQGPNSGFQSLLAQLQSGQGQSNLNPTREQGNGGWTIGSDGCATQSLNHGGQQNFFGQMTTSGANSTPALVAEPQSQSPFWSESQHGQTLERPHSASGRVVPDGYHAEPAQTFADLSGSEAKPVHAPGHWSSQAKRQDSYDKIRQFLRLDVDMGFPGSPKTESPTTAGGFRKRANSDVGPRSPIPGLGAGPDWLQALGPTAADHNKDSKSTDLDWESFKGKLEMQGLYSSNDFAGGSLTTAMMMQSGDHSQARTMDPSLINSSLGQIHTETSTGSFNNVPGQVSSASESQPGVFVSMPMAENHSILQGSDSQTDGNDVMRFAQSHQHGMNASWRFPFAGQTPQVGDVELRRSQSARHASGLGHRRAAQSEDLSRLNATNRFDQDDFLSRITAPDGGLAPPSSGRAVTNASGVASTSFYSSTGSARAHPYRTSHDRHHSFSSNASNSSAGSAAGSLSPMVHAGYSAQVNSNTASPAHYSQTALPMYGSLGTPRSGSVSSSVGSPNASILAAPPVPVVTSQATQAASASRRKGEALFSCPVPGCGSTCEFGR